MKAEILAWLNKDARIAVVRVVWKDYDNFLVPCFADFIAGPDGARTLMAREEWAPREAERAAAECVRFYDDDT